MFEVLAVAPYQAAMLQEDLTDVSSRHWCMMRDERRIDISSSKYMFDPIVIQMRVAMN